MAAPRCSLLLLLCALVALTQVEAQVDAPSPADAACASAFQKITPCQEYASGVVPDPPPACCTGLKEVVALDVGCLCEIFRNPGQYNLNTTQALLLPIRCGVPVSPAVCFLGPAPAPAPRAPPTPAPLSAPPSGPPATTPEAPATPSPTPAPAPRAPPPPPAPAGSNPVLAPPPPSAASRLKAIQYGLLAVMAVPIVLF